MNVLFGILAAAGGGSGSFGGGGGGGGGGGFSGGGGSYGSGTSTGGGGAFVLIFVLILVFVAVAWVRAYFWRKRRAQRARERETEVHGAALEAAQDDSDFDPDTVRTAASELFLEIQRRWSENDVDGLEPLVGEDLMVEWRRRLEDFARKGWHNKVTPDGPPLVEYLGLTNREGEDEDRVVVRITARCEDFVIDADGDTVLKDDATSTTTTVAEWWTLQPPGKNWRLLSIEQLMEGDHNLDSPLIATPSADARISDDALVETQMATALAPGFTVADIAPAQLEPDARTAALDLALEDGRFAPDVLEVAVRRAVEAWGEAIDGADTSLEAVADQAAVDALLYGGDASHTTRVVVRGAKVDRVAITGLDPHVDPATMSAEVSLRGRLYVENRDTTDVVSGSKDADTQTSQRWTFALASEKAAELPWRLVAVV